MVSSILERLILDDSGQWVLITGYSTKVGLVEAIVGACRNIVPNQEHTLVKVGTE